MLFLCTYQIRHIVLMQSSFSYVAILAQQLCMQFMILLPDTVRGMTCMYYTYVHTIDKHQTSSLVGTTQGKIKLCNFNYRVIKCFSAYNPPPAPYNPPPPNPYNPPPPQTYQPPTQPPQPYQPKPVWTQPPRTYDTTTPTLEVLHGKIVQIFCENVSLLSKLTLILHFHRYDGIVFHNKILQFICVNVIFQLSQNQHYFCRI